MKVRVCTEGKQCSKRGGGDVLSALRRAVSKCDLDDNIRVKRGGCFGMCDKGPVVLVKSKGLYYSYVSDSDCKDIIKSLKKKTRKFTTPRRFFLKKAKNTFKLKKKK